MSQNLRLLRETDWRMAVKISKFRCHLYAFLSRRFNCRTRRLDNRVT